ncbi:AbfB domain-containing protein [Actinoplanes solisilvae]|uniref:AbfB domain-containing protein n=1 Tax=Actinoplanes solisilvae TaxID=2486853 RepID=UPI000FD87606|nr:AbfB domain-containing protein [Actinoplanes solisilvae]
MPDEDRPEPLRIGGWVPPYRDTRGPLRPPVPPGRLGAIVRRTIPASMWPAPSSGGARSDRGRRLVLAGATGALIAVVGLTALGFQDDEPPGAPQAQKAQKAQNALPPPLVPTDPVSVLPSPSASSRSSSPSVGPTHRRVTATPTPGRRPTSRPPTKARLAPGETIGLASAAYPRYRLRHRDFVARFDAIGAGSTSVDRQDSRFTVRRGLAAEDCFSFESVNFPGHFLRHRNFVLRLDRRDRSALFAADATFCARPARGNAVFLESVNYPGRFLTARDGGVRLGRRDPIAFVISNPA